MDRWLERARKNWCRVAPYLTREFLRYWVVGLFVLVLSIWITPYADNYLRMVDVRYWIFQKLDQSTTNPARPRRVKLVLIKDDEYFGSALSHRVPVNRAYLARVVLQLAKYNASVIALDFDLRLPNPDLPGRIGDYSEIEPVYRGETEQLISAIASAASQHAIVLARTILQDADGQYYTVADSYTPFGICASIGSDGLWRNPGTREFPIRAQAQNNIFCGYIGVPRDMRQIPPPLELADGQTLNSFSYEIVRAADPLNPPDFGDRALYATYIPPRLLNEARVVISAHDLFSANPRTETFVSQVVRGNPVIVGAAWHERAIGFGNLVDMHDTPIGKTSGPLVHENFAEAMMSDRLYPALSPRWLDALEFAFGAAVLVGFFFIRNIWLRIGALIGVSACLFVAQWLALQILGTFFEAFIPVFGVGLHSVADRFFNKD